MVVTLVLLILFQTGHQFEIDHWGNHFVLTFLQTGDGEVKNSLIITTREDSNISVTFHESNQAKELHLRSDASHTLHFNANSTAKPSMLVLPLKAVSIEASKAISVYGFTESIDPMLYSKDGFLILPVPSLGVEYLAVTCEKDGPQIAIAAVENNTQVEIQIRCYIEVQCYHGLEVSTYQDNHVLTFLLNQHDVVNLYCIGDTTGSIVHSTKPVTVISGCDCVGGFHMIGCDHLVEMMPPTTEQGKQFVVANPADSLTILRILSTNNVTVSDDNGLSYSFQTHSRVTNVVLSEPALCLTSDKPIIVVMFVATSYASGSDVNALMTVVPPQTKYALNYSIGIEPNSINAVYIDMAVFICKVGNCPSNSIDFHPICQGRYGVKRELISGFNKWENFNPFMVLIFACRSDTCMGYPAGMALTDYSGVSECSSIPCMHNGWCLEYGITYRCRCWGGYGGDYCEKEPFEVPVEIGTASISKKESHLQTTEKTFVLWITKKVNNDIGLNPKQFNLTTDQSSTTGTTISTTKTTKPLSDKIKPSLPNTIASTSDSSLQTSASTSDPTTPKTKTPDIQKSDATKPKPETTLAIPKDSDTKTTLRTTISAVNITPFTTNNVIRPSFTNTNTTTPLNKVLRLCGCPCSRSAKKSKTPKIKTAEEILKVPKKKLGKTQRRMISAVNLYNSEINLGYSACSMLLFLILVVVITDVCKLIYWFIGWSKLRKPRDMIRVF
ncbi:hypothetical protein LOTGIDRAFT_163550 [Lottia gigantea]|uniref:EGF-like domain-containing protein n=1 Tax=Lottia gigantea TaxID=225164 RepID=V4A2V8_LOTGI|nr:hypothetical protein LOTGIDRAFT_163550 [Lottia gigantea]ESO91032.1 hypothetical protein LOTGIDRAFT_163550 [Lottia gigantea]